VRRAVVVIVVSALLGLLVPAVVAISADHRQTAEKFPGYATRPLLTAGDRRMDGVGNAVTASVGHAWGAVQDRAHSAWTATASTLGELTRKPQKRIEVASALPGAMSARLLIGAPVENSKEGRIASVADLVLGKDSRIDAVVISDGGFLGIGNSQIAVKPSLISLKLDANGTVRAQTKLTERHLDEATLMGGGVKPPIAAMREEFMRPEWRTVGKLLDAPVIGPNGEAVGMVSDILVTPAGEAQFALLSIEGNLGATRQVAVMIGSIHFTSRGAPVTISIPLEQLRALAPVRGVVAAGY